MSEQEKQAGPKFSIGEDRTMEHRRQCKPCEACGGSGRDDGLQCEECEGTGRGDDLVRVGDRVRKVRGDYRFAGVVVAVFAKTSGQLRCVVENADGILHIFSLANLEPEEPS